LVAKRLDGESFSASIAEAIAAIERAERIVQGLEPPLPAPIKIKRQVSIAVDDELIEKIDDLRRWRSPIPSVSDLLRELVEAAHEREGKRK
jgi:hypothetical protein